MRHSIHAALLAALVLAPASLLAQDVLPRPMVSGDTLQLTGVSRAAVSSWAGVYVGPYDGKITDARFTSGDPTRPQITLYCVDYAHDVNVGDSWQVNVSSLAAGSDMSNTFVGNLGAYQQAAFLAGLFDSWGSYVNNGSVTYNGSTQYTSKAQVYSGIAAAIWRITTPGFPSSFSGVNTTLAMAMSDYFYNWATTADLSGMSFAEWSVLTDVRGNVKDAGQEFLVRTASASVPEPATVLLLLSGLVVLFGALRFRRRESIGLA